MEFSQAISELVQAISACLPTNGWQAAFLDYELREIPGEGFDSDYVGIALIRNAARELEQNQFQLNAEARQAAISLYRQRVIDAEEANCGFVLRLECSGKYRIDFKEKVKRLAGIWDAEAESYADNYLQHYLRENNS